MNANTRVQIIQNGARVTLAQLPEKAAERYVTDISSEEFHRRMDGETDALLGAVSNATNEYVKEELSAKLEKMQAFRQAILDATFSLGFYLVPIWKQGDLE